MTQECKFDEIMNHVDELIKHLRKKPSIKVAPLSDAYLENCGKTEKNRKIRAIVSGFKQDNIDFVERCALLSEAVYEDDEDLDKILALSNRCELFPNNDGGVKGWIFKSVDKKYAIVVIRGSHTIPNWFLNFGMFSRKSDKFNIPRFIAILPFPILGCFIIIGVLLHIFRPFGYCLSQNAWIISIMALTISSIAGQFFWHQKAIKTARLAAVHYRYGISAGEIIKLSFEKEQEGALYTGHSLGGGLAMVAASINENNFAVGFNSAPGPMFNYNLCGRVFNFNTKDDVLTQFAGFGHFHLSDTIFDNGKGFDFSILVIPSFVGLGISIFSCSFGFESFSAKCVVATIIFLLYYAIANRIQTSINAHGMDSVLVDIQAYKKSRSSNQITNAD